MPVNGDYSDDELLQLSGLQHFLFCRRQWALIHIENIWSENYRTMDGDVMHQRAHSEMLTEKRGDTVITRGMAVVSRSLGVSGQCDVVEFKKSEEGVSIFGWDEKWLPFPVEYKRGQPKDGNFDAAQLCCQAMCLEEMLLCRIPSGALYYGETRRRTDIVFDEVLRGEVTAAIEEMHQLYIRGYTPKVKPQKGCSTCSIKEQCLPSLTRTKTVTEYLEGSL